MAVWQIRWRVIGSWMIKRYKQQIRLRTADVSPRSSPLKDVSRGGTSATRRQKFHADDVNQCPVVMGFQMQICSIVRFSWSIFENCCVHLRMSSHKQNSNASSREDYIPHILTVLLEIHRVYNTAFDLCRLLSSVCHS